MKKIILLTILVLLCTIILGATTLTRDDIITTARSYITINNWKTTKDSIIMKSTGEWESFYKKNITQSRMPYSYGCFNTPSNFNMSMNKCPGGIGTKAIYDTLHASGLTIKDSIAGIDCAGFVLKCWEIATYTAWTQCRTLGMEIDKSLVKKGDWINIPEHQLLFFSNTEMQSIDSFYYNVYESTSYIGGINTYPGVQYNLNRKILKRDLNVYSIFPQFSNPKPEKLDIVYLDEQPTTIELTIRASGDIDNTKIVSSTLVSGFC